MKLRPGEKVLKTYYHHFLPFLYRMVALSLASVPVFFLVYLFAQAVSVSTAIIAYTVVFVIFSIVSLYITLVYWLDRLVVTNRRIIFIDWKLLTAKTEIEAEFIDIQDISSRSTGILSLIPLFNYGVFEIQTASYNETIIFPEAPDPEGMKEFIHGVQAIGHPHRSHVGIDSGILVPDGSTTPVSPGTP
jgi:hypothetical protein